MKKISFILLALSVLALPSCFRTRAEIAREKQEKEGQVALQQSVVEYQQNFQSMQAEIGRLQGKIEELEFQRKKEMASQGQSVESNAKASTELKSKVEEMQKSQMMLFEEIKRLKEENNQLVAAQVSGKKSAAAGGGTKTSFDQALSLFKGKNYGQAAEAFRFYLESNPRSKKSTDARYYLGESLYRQKEYVDAIVEFGAIHEKSPTTTFGRKSTLRIAESFKALGKEKDAKSFAQILLQTSPNSSEAKQAKKLLK